MVKLREKEKQLHDFIDDVKSEDFIYINKGIIANMKNTKYVEGHDLIMKNMERLPIRFEYNKEG